MPDTALNRELEHAVLHHDARRVRLLLNAGADPNMVSSDEGDTILYPLWSLAATHGSNEAQSHAVFVMIAERVTAVNTPEGNGITLLGRAIDFNDLTLVKHLVAHGASVNPLSSNPLTFSPLILAVTKGGDRTELTPIISFLLDSGADANLPPGVALTNAAMLGKTETVRALLSHGADPTVRDAIGWTALRWAARKNDPSLIALLLGVSPLDLHEAAEFGILAKLQKHLDAGEAPNRLDQRGETPLMAALRGGNKAVVLLLLQRGAKVDARDKDGRTALHHAARYGLPEFVKLLLAQGADINAAPPPKEANIPPATPLTSAVVYAQADVVASLLKRGARLPENTTSLEAVIRDAGRPVRRMPSVPAKYALNLDQADDNRWRILELLTKAHGSAVVRANHSYVLYIAASRAQLDVVNYLLDHGADVNARDKYRRFPSHGATALMGALNAWGDAVWELNTLKTKAPSEPALSQAQENEQGAKAMVKCLLRRGANVHLADAEGQTPLELARKLKLPEAVQLLRRAGAK